MAARVFQLCVQVFQHDFRPFSRFDFFAQTVIHFGQAAIALAFAFNNAQIGFDAA